MKQLTAEHKKKMQEGRKRAKKLRPQKLKQVEAQMKELGAEIDRLRRTGQPIPTAMRQDLRALGDKRLNLKWSE